MIDMEFDFIAIDFETASSDTNSACSVGIVAVKNNRIMDSFYSLIKPPNLYFEKDNIEIHGITPQMVENAPTLDELWPEISQMFSAHCPVVAHNARFDMSVLRRSTTAEIPNFPYVDSMKIAASLVSGGKSLAACCVELQIDLENHHNALADAEASAKIALRGLDHAHCVSMWEYLATSATFHVDFFSDLKPQESLPKRRKSNKRFENVRITDIEKTVDILDPAHPLYGKALVFTGELSMSRREAMQAAVNVGAVIKSAVSKKTDYLIVGKQDISLVGDDGMSDKEERTYELNQSGVANIKIINEDEYISLLQGKVMV